MKLLLHSKSCMLLHAISKQRGEQGINEIGKDSYATYKSRWEVANELESKGLVFFEKLGREVIAFITPEGEKILGWINYILAL